MSGDFVCNSCRTKGKDPSCWCAERRGERVERLVPINQPTAPRNLSLYVNAGETWQQRGFDTITAIMAQMELRTAYATITAYTPVYSNYLQTAPSFNVSPEVPPEPPPPMPEQAPQTITASEPTVTWEEKLVKGLGKALYTLKGGDDGLSEV